MKNWRELGEVPASDDDDDDYFFDDDEPHHDDHNDDHEDDDQPDQLPRDDAEKVLPAAEKERVHTEQTKAAHSDNIWDVPSSSPQHSSPYRFGFQGQASQVLGQPPSSVQSKPRKDQGTTSSPSAPSHVAQRPCTPSHPSRTAKPVFLEDEISTGYVRVTTPGSRNSSPVSVLSRTPSPPRSPSLPRARHRHLPDRASPPPPQDPAGFAAEEYEQPEEPEEFEGLEELSRRTAVRLERSLRPRKPIQQHPYALENAQYATFMKSHGVKPVRVVQESRPALNEAQEEDSQDQEFLADESQEAADEVAAPAEENDSGPMLFDDEDEDELALTPSLPKTSPPGQNPRTSSQPTNADHTDATSVSDEEFPPLERLQPVSSRKRQRVLKRQPSRLLSSTQRKRPRRVLDSSSPSGSPQRPSFVPPPPPAVWDLLSSPPERQLVVELASRPSESLGGTPRRPVARPSTTPAAVPRSPRLPVSLLDDRSADAPITINEDTQSDSDEGQASSAELRDEDQANSTDTSGSDSEVVRRNGRRIRGVLPASWLRIDQQKDKPAAREARRRTPEASPERGVRRGVALPRQGLPSSTAPLLLFDESEESENESPLRRSAADDPARRVPAATASIDLDDGASDMEEDTIDWMLPGRKRTGSHNTSDRAKKQKRSSTQSMFKGHPNSSLRQPKITQVLSRSKKGAAGASAKRDSTTRRREQVGSSAPGRKSRQRAATPPLLSILDVVEPDAPRFVKIAARAVKSKANLGKASPSKKLISLATRADNVDALSVLRDWKSGKTRPKIPAPQPRRRAPPQARPALREISTNPTSRPRGAQPQKLVRQGSLDSFILVDDNDNDVPPPRPPPVSTVPSRKPVQDRRSNLHPAQLEEEETDDRRRQLNSRKRALDALYRRRRREADAPTDDGLLRALDADFTLREPALEEPAADRVSIENHTEEAPAPTKGKRRVVRSGARKGRCPQQVDLEAPQYTRANDPLPAAFAAIEAQQQHSQDKLGGLGPYGTHYTHHFEVFSLDRGVYLHESTVIGRGLLRDALDEGLPDRIRHQRLAVSFPLDGQTLRWGPWDDKTSSEFGILVDWVAEQLVSSTRQDEGTGRKAIEAADFVLGYILRSLSVQSDTDEKAFVSRALEVFSSFVSRFESMAWNTASDEARKAGLEVAVRFALSLLAVRSLSQASGSDPMQSMKLDDLLKKSASSTIRRLVDFGTKELRALYGDLQLSATRERGIRSDQVVANCWVVMIRLLESAAIPRGGFWDVTQSVMLGQGVASGSDAQVFEKLWEDMFTLLPLCEIDNSGLLIVGKRYDAPVTGWSLPQQLLKRVFQLYQASSRQPPGFNDYCRALVARCHFLVQQWGWRNCIGIIGTIFDFFGSQSLAHLRNEEVYKPPGFLEKLDCKPSLAIEPEDRCFHIFIKLLALAIQRLKDLDRVNDIRNLVARTLPNHNRQYLKEDTIRQHDLAALRNHHDLLCTLFWVAPPDLRPAIHLIEKLVVPGSAHKEACLINVRAWNQLARFVMSSGENGTAFSPLAKWRNNVFDQVLEQYLSAASDIEQQFRALSSEVPGVSKDARDEMVAKNKASALDVLHYSIRASLDVVQRAPTLGAALYGLNRAQLQKVFTSLDYQSPGFDWSILRAALEMLEHLLTRIDQASEEEYSSGISDNCDAPHLENAVLLVNEHLAKDFFWMSRTLLALPPGQSQRQQSQQAACTEKTVMLAARIAVRFINNRVTSMLPYFSTGKYSLFPDLPKNLSTPDSRYLPLFLAVFVKNHIFGFKDIDADILGLWMLSVVKPQRFSGYENYLAEVLKQHHLPFMARATVAVGIPPDYNSNVDFFACAMHYMRKTLRESGSAQSRHHREEFSRTLQLVMAKMKADLALLRPHPREHGPYIDFVRQVISLVKSHGVGICAVDPFFTQAGADYSPPARDPQLHAAGIVAYGVRLDERDATAAPQLFHYLHNSFKMAVGGGRVEEECRIVGRAMRNGHVLAFALQFMLPAVVRASERAPECWALLEVYTVALVGVLDRGCVPRELGGEDMGHAAGVLGCILSWLDALRSTAAPGAVVSLQQLHVLTLLATIANALQPSAANWLANEPDHPAIPGLRGAVGGLATWFTELQEHLTPLLAPGVAIPPSRSVPATALWCDAGLATGTASLSPPVGQLTPRVRDFANTIASDVGREWVVTADRVMVRMAAGRGTQGGGTQGLLTQGVMVSSGGGGGGDASLRGVRYAPWEGREVLERLLGEVGRWTLGVRKERRGGRGRELGDLVF
ncbi:Mus7/MMS22 family-domain-containing protein [Staphylotrichum tortipilum]|uniref:Mus7/MMS22 family-domain-containing protein n=1 Tax=Staphylotrichum tortipilum TaxID=2831512 RepID=A0AAN6MGP1_9PEZI|nr:Mus7/MMS22 family-domain-containing protein [Staphylotrichum longicolle]